MKEDWGSEKLINTKLVSGRGFSVGLVIKNPPVMQEMQVQSLSWEDPLEKEMATHASIPAWDIPWTEEPGRLQCMGSQRVGHDFVIKQQYAITQRGLIAYHLGNQGTLDKDDATERPWG